MVPQQRCPTDTVTKPRSLSCKSRLSRPLAKVSQRFCTSWLVSCRDFFLYGTWSVNIEVRVVGAGVVVVMGTVDDVVVIPTRFVHRCQLLCNVKHTVLKHRTVFWHRFGSKLITQVLQKDFTALMAWNGFLWADVLLRNYSLTHSLTHSFYS